MIRPAVETDLPYFEEIERQSTTLFQAVDPDLYRLFEPLLTDQTVFRDGLDNGRLWVAEMDGRPVGYVVVSLLDGHAHLQQIDVHPDYGRRGLGAALVETVCAWAKAQGFDAITLTTQRSIPWNMPFYAKHGFVEFEPDAPPYLTIMAVEEALGFYDRVWMKREL